MLSYIIRLGDEHFLEHDMKSLILASGFGTRLYPLTVSKPKGLIQYQGKPIISHIVEKIPQAIEILVNTNKKFESDFHRWQETINRKITLCVEPVFTEKQSFGAVGSLAYWARDFDDDLLVIASDNYFEFDLSEFISAYDSKNTLVAVCNIGDKSKVHQFGVVQLEGHKIVTFEEKPRKPKSRYVATACYLFPPRVFPLIYEFASKNKGANLGNLVAHLVTRDNVRAYIFTELWVDIGTPETLCHLIETGDTSLP